MEINTMRKLWPIATPDLKIARNARSGLSANDPVEYVASIGQNRIASLGG